MLDLLLVVEHEPAFGAEHLSVRLRLDEFYLVDKVFPLLAILFNHFLFNMKISGPGLSSPIIIHRRILNQY